MLFLKSHEKINISYLRGFITTFWKQFANLSVKYPNKLTAFDKISIWEAIRTYLGGALFITVLIRVSVSCETSDASLSVSICISSSLFDVVSVDDDDDVFVCHEP